MTSFRSLAAAAALCAMTCGAMACGATGSSPSPHPLDIVLQPENVYEKNPAVRLQREYWIVFQNGMGGYAMYPRPDGHPEIARECERGSSLGLMFQAARLCTSAASSADLARVNALTREEAMQTSTFLHAGLRFRSDGKNIAPYMLISDLALLCTQHPSERAGVLKTHCDQALAENRSDVSITFSSAELEILPGLLNELYGVAQ